MLLGKWSNKVVKLKDHSKGPFQCGSKCKSCAKLPSCWFHYCRVLALREGAKMAIENNFLRVILLRDCQLGVWKFKNDG